jgi:hypothetical protein
VDGEGIATQRLSKQFLKKATVEVLEFAARSWVTKQ